MARRLTNTIRTLRFHPSEMTQADLGDRIGVTQTVAAMEKGKYAPSLGTAFRIDDVFGLPGAGLQLVGRRPRLGTQNLA